MRANEEIIDQSDQWTIVSYFPGQLNNRGIGFRIEKPGEPGHLSRAVLPTSAEPNLETLTWFAIPLPIHENRGLIALMG